MINYTENNLNEYKRFIKEHTGGKITWEKIKNRARSFGKLDYILIFTYFPCAIFAIVLAILNEPWACLSLLIVCYVIINIYDYCKSKLRKKQTIENDYLKYMPRFQGYLEKIGLNTKQGVDSFLSECEIEYNRLSGFSTTFQLFAKFCASTAGILLPLIIQNFSEDIDKNHITIIAFCLLVFIIGCAVSLYMPCKSLIEQSGFSDRHWYRMLIRDLNYYKAFGSFDTVEDIKNTK